MVRLATYTVLLAALGASFFVSPAHAVPPPWAHERNMTYNFQPDYYAQPYRANNTVIIVHDKEEPPATVVQAPQDYDYYYQDGKYCREYRSRVEIGGNVRTTYGTACQQPDGQWEVVN